MAKAVKAVVKNAVPILVGAAITAAFAPAGVAFMTAFTSAALAGAALTAVGAMLAPNPPSVPTVTIKDRGRDQQFKQPITNRQTIYGRIRTSGPMVFVETTNKNKFMHIVIAIAPHEINTYESMFLNDTAVGLISSGADSDGNTIYVGSGKYEGKLRVKYHYGTDSQKADPQLVNESQAGWSTNHRLRGVAYVYVRLTYDADVWSQGVPKMSWIVEGKKVLDFRNSTTAYSANPALCIYDYLTDSQYGLGCATSEIDTDSFTTAANACDESVTTVSGGSEKRFEMHGVVDTGATPRKLIQAMLTSLNGNLVYSGGKWVLNAGVFRSSSKTITEDNIVGSLNVQSKTSRAQSANAIKGVYISPNASWQPTDYPEITSSVFKQEDGGETRYMDFELPFTTSSSMAQRIAKAVLYRSRQQIVVSVKCDISMVDVKIGDTVALTFDRYGWSAKTFEVTSYSLTPIGDGIGVDLVLKEISTTVYDWDAEERSFAEDNTSLASAFTVDEVGLTLSDEVRSVNETPTNFLVAEVTSGSSSTQEFEVQAKKSDETEYVNLGRASGNKFELANVDDGQEYDVRARGINSLGIRSVFTTKSRVIVGKTAPPSNVTNFSVNVIGENAHLYWTAVDDADLSHYRIRHSAETSSAKFSEAREIVAKVSRPATSVVVPAETGTYFIKAVDKLGNSSATATSKIALINTISTENIVQTITESPTFTGSKSLCSVVSNKLQINTSQNQAFYNFATDTDLGAKYQCRIKANVKFTRLERSGLFDDQFGNFDDRKGLFDGTSDAEHEDVSAVVQFRWTDDDPNSSPTWSDWEDLELIVIAARAFQFRIKLDGDSSNYTPQVGTLEVEVDMPDRTLADNDVSSGTSAKSITFSPAFKSLEGLAITAQDMDSGDYYTITGKSASGFTVEFKNSSDTNVDRTFDYVARGYGEVIT